MTDFPALTEPAVAEWLQLGTFIPDAEQPTDATNASYIKALESAKVVRARAVLALVEAKVREAVVYQHAKLGHLSNVEQIADAVVSKVMS